LTDTYTNIGQTHAQTDRQTHAQTDGQTQAQTDGQTHVQTDGQTQTQTDGQTHAQTDGQTYGQTGVFPICPPQLCLRGKTTTHIYKRNNTTTNKTYININAM